MVSKLVLASLFFSGNVDAAASQSSPYSPPPSMSGASSSTATSWQWPSCTQARTTSFGRADDEVSSTRRGCKTRVITNPAYCDDHSAEHSFLSATDSSTSTTAPVVPASEVDEVIIRGLRASSRLFFEPAATSSIVKPAAAAFGAATAMAIDSADPYDDFRRSMEEMVLSHGANGEDD
ncbi:hypothetical protein ACQ4PT_028998 [Festuca glaucescens]